ncbi:DUF6310 domain-containing protein [Myxococcus sp. K38C18041901]|uniref:DUF6310 domain-containing protein n=1 Tax=Myxococcus guangdongensis TaxID=2906760 RepID=UPI0020A72306|nr:DUF6310 domain-containing protein [Myxococcus guangdongensis]MCP3061982.1 DUF6310 domain-containing protein [Myxococcus guangdongensis]
MRFGASAVVLLLLSACATSAPETRGGTSRNPRLANLQRAASLPWLDEGQCAVREASQPWPVLAERCYQVLDHDRLEFRDTTGRCSVASAGAAAVGLGLCVLAAPEIIVGTVVVLGVVVVAAAIHDALEAHELRRRHAEEAGDTAGTTQTIGAAEGHRKPERDPAEQGSQPPVPPLPVGSSRHPHCEPVPVPRASKDVAHNACADRFPPNRYPGMDVSVNGVRFDALQVGARVLWEIKTHRFDTYNGFIQEQELEKELKQLSKERDTAIECGYDFVVGVSTEAHRDALFKQESTFTVVVTGCQR